MKLKKCWPFGTAHLRCDEGVFDELHASHPLGGPAGLQGQRWLNGYTARLPPRRAGFILRPGHSRIFAGGNRSGRCLWSADFLGYLPFPPPLHSGAAPFSHHFILIGSQDFVFKSRPNLSPRPTFFEEFLCKGLRPVASTFQSLLPMELPPKNSSNRFCRMCRYHTPLRWLSTITGPTSWLSIIPHHAFTEKPRRSLNGGFLQGSIADSKDGGPLGSSLSGRASGVVGNKMAASYHRSPILYAGAWPCLAWPSVLEESCVLARADLGLDDVGECTLYGQSSVVV
ncbi:hypothetical protein PR048_012330 [Dryococelus australis]|uniref:Uncharacterized protein n=1 Tax=Dryococelus australis TaxID=614101 RepID=A0ABQ9HP78_9NEOP|nr:hypothetical protein PR048_012330 [Dryococelus australis]